MDQKDFNALVFMVFGLGFFLLVMMIILRDDKVSYERRLNEKREFGVELPRDQNAKRHQRK